jgi:hypothetical protein
MQVITRHTPECTRTHARYCVQCTDELRSTAEINSTRNMCEPAATMHLAAAATVGPATSVLGGPARPGTRVTSRCGCRLSKHTHKACVHYYSPVASTASAFC